MSHVPVSTNKLVAIVVVVIIVSAAALAVIVIDNPFSLPSVGTDTNPILAFDDPIRINGDEELFAYVSNHSLEGSGNSMDPYVIANLSIVADGVCIDIQNIESAFVIQNCKLKTTLDYGGIALYLGNCLSVAVESCRTEGGISGIELFQCNDAKVRDCQTRFTIFGINSSLSQRVSVSNNRISNVTMGISVIGSNETIIENNDIFNTEYGLVSQFSTNCSVLLCNLTDNRIGIQLEFGCHNWMIHSNVFVRNYEYHAIDDGRSNLWDNDLDFGNYWDDYLGVGTYAIPGSAGSIDRYPQGL